MVAIVIVVLLVLGGGVSFTAEQALPGDMLYGVKTAVNENVRSTIAVGTEADAKWEAQLAERRLAEAEKLSAEGKLDAEVGADLSAQFQSHAESALTMASELRANGKTQAAAEVESDVDAAIQAHAGLTNALTQADEHAIAAIQAAISKIEAKIRVSGEANGGASAEARVGDMDHDGKPDTAQSDTDAAVKSETSAEIRAGGASLDASGTIKLGN